MVAGRRLLVLLVAAMALVGCTAATPPTRASAAASTPALSPPSNPPSSTQPPSTQPPSNQPSNPAASASSGSGPPPSTPAPATGTVAAPPPGQIIQLGPGVSDEASGVAVSTTRPGAYFLVDDSTGTDEVVAVGRDGSLIDRIPVAGMSADNAEALASGPCGSTQGPGERATESCLYIGDIGDNKARRPDVAIYRVAEPDLGDGRSDPVPADEWRYTYPDGPHNAEAMLVDADGSLLIVTKPTGGVPHRMYRAAPGGGDLEFVREFRPPDATRPLRTLLTGNVVTDLGSAPGRVLLLTYDEVQEYTAPDPGAALSTFPDWPHRRLPAPALPQAEGIATDGCGFVVASEAGPTGDVGSLLLVNCS